MNELTVIEDVRAIQVFDSRGDYTIEVDVETPVALGRFAAPAGKSKGAKEVTYYPPGGVQEALRQVEELAAPELIGVDSSNQAQVDSILHDIDGTSDFSVIGGSTAYAISMAAAEAAANSMGIPLFMHVGGVFSSTLPLPLGNVLGGGSHAGEGAPDIQEYLVVPLTPSNATEALKQNFMVHRKLRDSLKAKVKGFTGGKGDEGAFAPNMDSISALETVVDVASAVSDEVGGEIGVGLDVAASSLWDGKKYIYKRDEKKLSREEQINFMLSLMDRFGLVYLEDPLHEDDFEGFAEMTSDAGRTLICGDDLFVTKQQVLKKGVDEKAGNAIIIKPNQVGTLSDAYDAASYARENGFVTVASHRSGETETGHLAHVAVGFGCSMLKAGVLGGERIAKANELLRIADFLGEKARLSRL